MSLGDISQTDISTKILTSIIFTITIFSIYTRICDKVKIANIGRSDDKTAWFEELRTRSTFLLRLVMGNEVNLNGFRVLWWGGG